MHIVKKQEIEKLKLVKKKKKEKKKKREGIEKWVLLGGDRNEKSHRGRRKEAMKRKLKSSM